MAFNPNQPRDPHGRFGEVAHIAANALGNVVSASGNAAHVAAAIAGIASTARTNYLASFRRVTGDFAMEAAGLLVRGLQGAHTSLTPEQRTDIKAYSASGASYINAVLRKDLKEELNDPNFQKVLKSLDTSISKSKLPENLILYRGSSVLLDKLKPGAIIRDDGYMSTSLDRRIAEHFVSDEVDGKTIKLYARQGMSALPLSTMAKHQIEREVLLPRGSRFRVFHEDDNDVHAELL